MPHGIWLEERRERENRRRLGRQHTYASRGRSNNNSGIEKTHEDSIEDLEESTSRISRIIKGLLWMKEDTHREAENLGGSTGQISRQGETPHLILDIRADREVDLHGSGAIYREDESSDLEEESLDLEEVLDLEEHSPDLERD
ncbi:hypothetical protein Scep_014309 [Stephania cephalantha]|uniref:Uncharacterized protein n=1 Tax=Stephania cephalantha TaxID=152367 RepID=A0AAP0J2W1_9MAGN